MMQDRYGRLIIVSVFVIIAVVLLMAPGMHSDKDKTKEKEMNFTSMPKDSKAKQRKTEAAKPDIEARPIQTDTYKSNSNEKFVSPEEQMLDAWGMSKSTKKATETAETQPQRQLQPEVRRETRESVVDRDRTEAADRQALAEAVNTAAPLPDTTNTKLKQIKVNGKCFSAPKAVKPMSKSECDKVGYQFRLHSCPKQDSEYDGWAGAVKECGGIYYMPDMDDLLGIARILYSNSTINITQSERSKYKAYGDFQDTVTQCDDYEVNNLKYNASVAKEYGFPSNGGFLLWGKTEISPEYALGLSFKDTQINYNACTPKSSVKFYAICKVDCSD